MTARRANGLAVALASIAVAAALVAGCGIGDQESAEQIDFDEFPATTLTATSSPATTPVGSAPWPTDVVASTTAPELAPFPIYFARGTALAPVAVELPSPPSLEDVGEALAAGPPADPDDGTRSLVEAGLIRALTLRDGRLTIDLDSAALERVSADEQRQLIGQLVLSFAEHPGIDGIDQWLFTIDQEPLRVIRRDGTLSQPGVPVGRRDYDLLIEGDVVGQPALAEGTPAVQ